MMAVSVLLAAMAQVAATAPRPSNAGAWIAIDDYPADALAGHHEGVVAVRLDVDEGGRVAACTIAASSGAPSLDATTCALLFVRARFHAASDATGHPVAGSFATRITWRYPTAVAAAPQPTSTPAAIDIGDHPMQQASGQSILHVDEQGIITACDPQEPAYANTLRPPDICGLFPVGVRFSPPTVRRGRPVRRKINVRLDLGIEAVR